MVNLASVLVGPLAGPECRRAVARGWLILVRCLAAFVILGVVLLALWVWWINQRLDPDHRPYFEVRIGLAVVEGMLVTVALVLGPAVLAGSLAGDRERGALALLLTTRVSSREIVTGRLAGKLAQVGMILLGGAPAVVGLASLGGGSPARIGIELLLPAAVGLGAGGLAALASTLSRRGRDALLSVYLVELFLMLTPLLGVLLPSTSFALLSATNPYFGLEALVFREEMGIISVSIGFWMVVGVAGAAGAAWRLRPSCLAPLIGERVVTMRGRRGYVPPVNEKRPMVWKELFIERVGTLGKFGRWVGALLMGVLLGGSLGLMAVIAWDGFRPGHPEWAEWAREQLGVWVGGSGGWLNCLIQWAIGLRAAVSISSERERGTWDALMTSPLDGGEIVRGKLWGSLYALRGLILCAFVAWGLAAAVGGVPVKDAVRWGSEVLVVGAFMAAVGVRTSLACQTATRAMALTIGIWLGAYVLVSISALIALTSASLIGNALRMAAGQLGLASPQTTFWAPVSWNVAWPVANGGVYLVMTLLIVADTRLRFDRLAGRMTGGKAAVAFGEMLYGRPEEPVLLESYDDPFVELLPVDVEAISGEAEEESTRNSGIKE